MPAWIHDRAMRIKREGKLEEQYGKEKGKQVAFALATQMAHRLGKSPKKFKSKETGKMETFGTPQGRREAKLKYDQPKREYQKTAADGGGRDVVMLSPDRAQQIAERVHAVGPYASAVVPGVLGAIGGGLVGTLMSRRLGKAAPAIGAALGTALGGGAGAASYTHAMKGRNPGKYERRIAQRAIRAAERQGYNPVVQDSWLKIDRPKVREILRQDARLARESGVKAPRPSEMFKRKEGMVTAMVSDLAFDILEKEAKAKALKQLIKKVVGQSPGGMNPLNPGSGIKGMVGRLKPM